MSTIWQRLRNILWGALGGLAAGVVSELVLPHGQMSLWFFVSAITLGSLSGLFGRVRRKPELYWSGLLDWCFVGNHPAYPRT